MKRKGWEKSVNKKWSNSTLVLDTSFLIHNIIVKLSIETITLCVHPPYIAFQSPFKNKLEFMYMFINYIVWRQAPTAFMPRFSKSNSHIFIQPMNSRIFIIYAVVRLCNKLVDKYKEYMHKIALVYKENA